LQELSLVLGLPVDTEAPPSDAPASARSLASVLEAITDGAPSHFQAAVEGILQANNGATTPNFLSHAVLAARGAAMREVLARGSGSAWAGRPSTFEFVVELVARRDPAFKAAYAASVTHNAAQLNEALNGGGPGGG